MRADSPLGVVPVVAAAGTHNGTTQQVAEEEQGGLLDDRVLDHLPLSTGHDDVDACI